MLHQTRIGSLAVGAQGFGAMGISEFYGPTDEREARSALEAALELGVTYYDTADIYGSGHNEQFLAPFIAAHRDEVVIGSKFGIVRDPDNPASRGVDNSETHIRRSVEASLGRLGVDRIDLYYMHRKDPRVPIVETAGVLSDLVDEGKIHEIGLSEVTATELEDAHAVHPVAAVQTEWSLFSRDAERFVVPKARELEVCLVAYAPLSRGLLAGSFDGADAGPDRDSRRTMPRFSGGNLRKNRDLLAPIRDIAVARNASVAQIALAWVHGRSEEHGLDVVPIPGTRRPQRVAENVGSASIELSDTELGVLSKLAAEVAGERYPDLSFTYLERESTSQ